jgi:hypothetical protein
VLVPGDLTRCGVFSRGSCRAKSDAREGSKWPPLFVWLGAREADAHGVYVNLTDSYEQAVAIAGAFPTATSGVGRWGRLTVPLPVKNLDLLLDWVDESYRNVAPQRLVALLDSRLLGR